MALVYSSGRSSHRNYNLSLDERVRMLGYASYEAYIQSDHWQEFRQRYRSSGRSGNCQCCDRYVPGRMVLHHISYDRLGYESLDDVRPLCMPCHELLHQIHRKRDVALDHFGIAVGYLRRQVLNRALRQIGNQGQGKKKKRRRGHRHR